MTYGKQEATAIARLLASDGKRTVGWVYLWHTSELSILWIGQEREAAQVAPPIPPETLARAKDVNTDTVTDLLETLMAGGPTMRG